MTVQHILVNCSSTLKKCFNKFKKLRQKKLSDQNKIKYLMAGKTGITMEEAKHGRAQEKPTSTAHETVLNFIQIWLQEIWYLFLPLLLPFSPSYPKYLILRFDFVTIRSLFIYALHSIILYMQHNNAGLWCLQYNNVWASHFSYILRFWLITISS